ncbi:MAG: hypothetical protein CMN30_19395 [Sandaracinus sp.]|nr:hypothetical protein [Sandaracinus sp.]
MALAPRLGRGRRVAEVPAADPLRAPGQDQRVGGAAREVPRAPLDDRHPRLARGGREFPREDRRAQALEGDPVLLEDRAEDLLLKRRVGLDVEVGDREHPHLGRGERRRRAHAASAAGAAGSR